jgi:F-type H+-transporting ATPase subunit a
MHNGHGFNWLSSVPVLGELPNHVVMAAFVCVVLLGFMAIARVRLMASMRGPEGGLVPDSTWTIKNFFEIISESLYGLTVSVLGEHEAPRYFPLVGTLFLFIFTSNLLGLIPGLLPPTDNLNTTLALGLFVFIYYNYAGIRENGLIKHLKHLLGPVWWLAWLMLPIELVSHIARPISLALRLRGNIMGDHMVLGIFNGLVPYIVPMIFYTLGIFVSFVQAFVFCLMTMVYISLATAHDEGH